MQIENMKCRNCGGELDYSKAVNGVLTCAFCGSKFTVPKNGASEQVRSFLLMGEHELDVGHFDEAATAYAKAAELDPKEPEAFFGLALATAQVQHLRDEVKDCLQPICYSTSDKPFVQDTNYKRALSLATPEQKKEYEFKGKEIDIIREEFREFRNQGLNYDCFICVKVSEEGTSRHTEDSFIASKLYKELKNAGYSPFYSEEEIHGRTGVMYEAMILYALYSAQSMLLVCSDESYLQTKWVKNEYSRFLKMQRDDEKARGSLTVVFKGAPVDRIPGLNGRVQGIDFNSYDALNRVLSFVQQFKKADIPSIKRKEYGQTKVNKISATRQGVEKRKLATASGGEVSVSDRAKLTIVSQCLQRKDFVNARKFVDKVIAENPANGEAYMLRFLAEMSCTNEVDLQRAKTKVTSYDDFEKALASADRDRSKQLYSLLYSRVYFLKNVEDYDEYIALPDSEPKEINELTELMYNKAKQLRDTEIFDSVIKTVTDTRKYIDMNLEFMNMISATRSEYERSLKRKYCDNILAVDNANEQALWCKFTDEHSSVLDIDKAVIEESLFAYGYNKTAVNNLMEICLSNAEKSSADELFDFLLSMIPEKFNGDYVKNIKKYIEAKFKLKNKNLVESVKKYNEMLLAADSKDDEGYFNRVMIKNGYHNPLQLINIVNELMSDDDYSTAIMVYTESHPQSSRNYYMDVIDELKKVDKQLSSSVKWRKHCLENVYVSRGQLANCHNMLKEPEREVAATTSSGSYSSGSSGSSYSGRKYRAPADGAKICRIIAYLSPIVLIICVIIGAVASGNEMGLAAIGMGFWVNVILIVLIKKAVKNGDDSKATKLAIGLIVANVVLSLAGICIPFGILVD